ncbi:winged helix-turn-helix transcriptional regulator [Hyphomonas sp.]|jgi:DNA-binding HxlR family transcriptional regulator|uniref:winged helix-turn-helix transcriptional regulator n=1 Tax=Hyphomonas sp. TaxID=87 RepID=UPI0039E2BB12
MTKRPGTPVRGSATGRPIMVLLDVLGQRWTLRILWELRGGPATFRVLRTRCDELSPTVLNLRLKTLRDLNLVGLDDDGYSLTVKGYELGERLGDLDTWARDWARTTGSQAE